MASSGRRLGSQDHYTGQRHRCQENHAMLGEREQSQNSSGGLDVVDRRIMLRRWPSGSRTSVHTWKSMEVPPQLSGHWAHGGLRCQAVGDWTHSCGGDGEERNIPKGWSEDGGNLQRLADHNLTRGTPGARPGRAISDADHSESAATPRPRHCN